VSLIENDQGNLLQIDSTRDEIVLDYLGSGHDYVRFLELDCPLYRWHIPGEQRDAFPSRLQSFFKKGSVLFHQGAGRGEKEDLPLVHPLHQDHQCDHCFSKSGGDDHESGVIDADLRNVPLIITFIDEIFPDRRMGVVHTNRKDWAYLKIFSLFSR